MVYSSSEITLKSCSHMWSGVGELITEEITGSIKIRTVEKSCVSFNGNRVIKK